MNNLIFIAPYKERVNETDFVENPYEINFSINGLILPKMDGESFYKFLDANENFIRRYGYATSKVHLFEEEEEMRVSDLRELNLHMSFHLKGDDFGAHNGRVLFAYSIMEENMERTKALLCCEKGGGFVYVYDIEKDAFYVVAYPEKEQVEKIAKRIFGVETTVFIDDNAIKIHPQETCMNEVKIQEFTKLALVEEWILTNGVFEITFNL